MCGIWAFYTINKINDIIKLFRAFMKIKHSGPDCSTFNLLNDNLVLGFHRLAIMDLSSAGNQPFDCVNVILFVFESYII